MPRLNYHNHTLQTEDFSEDLKKHDHEEADTSRTCDFQQCGILTSVDIDMPVHHPFKLRNSK